MNTRIALSAVVPGLLALAALAGCSGDSGNDAAPPIILPSGSGLPAGSVLPSEGGGGYTSPAAAGAAKGSPTASPRATTKVSPGGGAGCPVTAVVLEKAFKANSKVASALVLGKGLTSVSCSSGWATAVTQPTDVDPAVVVFKYDTARKAWAAVAGGTDGVCRDTVPEDVQTHLAGCRN